MAGRQGLSGYLRVSSRSVHHTEAPSVRPNIERLLAWSCRASHEPRSSSPKTTSSFPAGGQGASLRVCAFGSVPQVIQNKRDLSQFYMPTLEGGRWIPTGVLVPRGPGRLPALFPVQNRCPWQGAWRRVSFSAHSHDGYFGGFCSWVILVMRVTYSSCWVRLLL